MKKSTRTLLGTATAAALGALLILGGAGSLAFWSDSSTSATKQIQSGSLDLGTASGIDLADATIKSCTATSCTSGGKYTGSPIVPGDVITGTATVRVDLVGQNISADLIVKPTRDAGTKNSSGDFVASGADTALHSAISVTIKGINADGISGTQNASRTVKLGPTAAWVPVVFEVAFSPSASNQSMGGKVSIGALYTLTQTGAA